MRNFKKITALALVVAMLISLVTVVSVAAAETVNISLVVADGYKASVKTGDTIMLEVHIESTNEEVDTVALRSAVWQISYDTDAFTAAVKPGGALGVGAVRADEELIKMTNTGGMDEMTGEPKQFNVAKGAAAQKIELVAKKEVTSTEEFALAFTDVLELKDMDGNALTVTPSSATVSIVPSFAATQVLAYEDDVEAEIGTAEADLVLPTEATVADVTGLKTEALEVAGEWTSEDYDANTIGEYTFTNTVVADEEGAASFDGELTAAVTVNVVAATAYETTSIEDFKLEPKKDAAYTEEELVAAVKEEVGAITATTALGIKDTFTNTTEPAHEAYTVALKEGVEITNENNDVITMEITIKAGASDNGKIVLAEDQVEEINITIKKSGGNKKPGGVPPTGGGSAVTPEKPDTGVPDSGTGDLGEDKDPTQGVPDIDEPGTDVPGTDVPGTPVAGLFEDVPADHWAADYIKEMKDKGIVGGKTATTFEPDATITRAEFVKMIATA
ncbi:MAG: S-layer homology domain-containing protein, partial [Clostridia bacterium]|nr:S-layer homology domain-containing protein [Clostridia bacterium]